MTTQDQSLTLTLTQTLTLAPWQLECRVAPIMGRITGGADWPIGSRHYQCLLYQVGYGRSETYLFEYSQGPAHTKAPKLADLVWCVLQDARVAQDYADEWEMAHEYGMEIHGESDYLRIVDMYRACTRANDWLHSTFGPDQIEGLERLFEDF